jgi:predicted cupin superfamily sugar epimerase
MDADEIIGLLGLRRHPEGGWFTETWRSPTASPAIRPTGTAIYYLLKAGEASRWHRLDASETWHHYAGDAIELRLAPGDAGPVETRMLGMDLDAGERPQIVIPEGWWQAARPLGAWTLVGCTVSPGFEYSGFELAKMGWDPG